MKTQNRCDKSIVIRFLLILQSIHIFTNKKILKAKHLNIFYYELLKNTFNCYNLTSKYIIHINMKKIIQITELASKLISFIDFDDIIEYFSYFLALREKDRINKNVQK